MLATAVWPTTVFLCRALRIHSSSLWRVERVLSGRAQNPKNPALDNPTTKEIYPVVRAGRYHSILMSRGFPERLSRRSESEDSRAFAVAVGALWSAAERTRQCRLFRTRGRRAAHRVGVGITRGIEDGSEMRETSRRTIELGNRRNSSVTQWSSSVFVDEKRESEAKCAITTTKSETAGARVRRYLRSHQC
jgi:hypothetical protein